MIEIDWIKVQQQLLYDPKNLLLFNSGFFVYFFLFFILCYFLVRKQNHLRALVLSLFSLYFFYKASGFFVFLVIGTSIVNFTLSNFIYRLKSQVLQKTVLVISIVCNLGVLFYFKYTNFVIELINSYSSVHFNALHLILPIGISFYTFENLSYTVDVYRKEIEPEKKIVNYLLFLSFFPKLVMGPIVRAKDFIPQLKKPYFVSATDFSAGFYLIISGLIKKLIISDYVSLNLVDYVFDGPSLHNGFECLMAMYGYAIVIYCDFSGYSDVAIGISKWLGISIPANFLSPYQSTSISDFWRRWHISLSSWLRDYLYIPLGGNKGGKLRTNINLFLTMVIGGFWHGASFNFIIWGALHGFGLIINKIASAGLGRCKRQYIPKKVSNLFFGLLTFHFVCFCWIFFRASDWGTAVQFIYQIQYQFTFANSVTFLSNYKIALSMIGFGFIIHLIPDSWAVLFIEKQKHFSLFYFIVVAFLFLMVYSYFKSAQPVMPIYLQF